ncbi:MAG TPA: peptidase [Lachnospiraceae bacterium]|nr:peptidase [Lachnospiraceae bacterium]
MLFFVLACVCLIVTACGVIYGITKKDGCGFCVAGISFFIAVLLFLPSVLYAQDVGEVKVIRNMGGSVAGISADAGFHVKAPWQSTITYDVRNNVLSFMGDEEDDQFEGGSANGSAITINDQTGTASTVDIQVNYSLDPQTAQKLYEDYGTQENFVKSVCAVDIRAIPREISGQFDTISILTARGEFTKAIQDALTEKWKGYGLNVESVSVQNVVYPDSVKTKYAEATAAEIAKTTAENNLEVAKVNAQQKVVESQAEADANRILAESLSNEVLTQHYIDALSNADSLVVVPDGSSPLISTK